MKVLSKTLIIIFTTVSFHFSALAETRMATADGLEYMKSTEAVAVVESFQFIRFSNKLAPLTKGLLIQPGGEVDPRAYAGIAQMVATTGYPVVIDKTPSELVIAGVMPNMIPALQAANPDITDWVIAGHSLGGVIASQYIAENPQDISISGLALWASFPNPELPIPYRTDLKVVSIYGENDCLVPPADVLSLAWTLPVNTVFVQVDGGNHAQFGDYGSQDGDCAATISGTVQKLQVTAHTIEHTLL
ncbi:alpha/beta hydrolase [Paraferrimonas sp. SM1919]|uniref:alpha/beta hydrolase n=1 Tax=Paraferrimonas sp. SM1919 TaxID=2662263 RepID=UPI0013D4554E|nr:alpha/beta hydrolase [Paraferrimonas sp. SM1919]